MRFFKVFEEVLNDFGGFGGPKKGHF
jgi:hypothetical protein